MTIKEIEQLTGMTRANIRFYEQQGLLNPRREENNYREYTEEDVEVLKKIKLLRAIHVPLEDIKSMSKGDTELKDVLSRQEKFLGEGISQHKASREVCRAISNDNVTYDNLKAEQYLNMMNTSVSVISGRPAWPERELKKDVLTQEPVTWRRYFARMLDSLIYSGVWFAILSVVFRANVTLRTGTLDGLVTMTMMIFMEPLFLLKFGTTPGKWILGLRVKDQRGQRRYYSEYLRRTWQVFWKGMGFQIPVYSWVCLYRSYKKAEEGSFLPWDYETDMYVEVRDKKIWRIPAWIGAFVAMGTLVAVTSLWAALPPNRGDITVADYSENYNYMLDYYDLNLGYELNEKGLPIEGGEERFYFYEKPELPVWRFTTEDDVVTSITFENRDINVSYQPSDYRDDIIVSVLAFAGAQEGRGLSQKAIDDALSCIADAGFGPFVTELYGVEISREVEHRGFKGGELSSKILIAEDGVPNEYYFKFTMKKLD